MNSQLIMATYNFVSPNLYRDAFTKIRLFWVFFSFFSVLIFVPRYECALDIRIPIRMCFLTNSKYSYRTEYIYNLALKKIVNYEKSPNIYDSCEIFQFHDEKSHKSYLEAKRGKPSSWALCHQDTRFDTRVSLISRNLDLKFFWYFSGKHTESKDHNSFHI